MPCQNVFPTEQTWFHCESHKAIERQDLFRKAKASDTRHRLHVPLFWSWSRGSYCVCVRGGVILFCFPWFHNNIDITLHPMNKSKEKNDKETTFHITNGNAISWTELWMADALLVVVLYSTTRISLKGTVRDSNPKHFLSHSVICSSQYSVQLSVQCLCKNKSCVHLLPWLCKWYANILAWTHS